MKTKHGQLPDEKIICDVKAEECFHPVADLPFKKYYTPELMNQLTFR